ncbi:unnamed protein product [Prorocentrum cordatum]|uniref:ApaG domain-containing protein n=1 Tax=Prorocentrum cordatum TaxID=2364126 RepID=A0ABN9VPE7_9DINO|nr:unnamed protein product [Polarella glacialis]
MQHGSGCLAQRFFQFADCLTHGHTALLMLDRTRPFQHVDASRRVRQLLLQVCPADERPQNADTVERGIRWPTSSECSTEEVKVTAKSEYDPGASSPEKGKWEWNYTVTIRNESDRTVQLLTRHWVITDASGRQQEVGPQAYGVVGQQPILRPGESFSYVSGCPLPTSFGTLQGSYEMVVLEPAALHGQRFHAQIDGFGLTMDGSDALMPIVIP